MPSICSIICQLFVEDKMRQGSLWSGLSHVLILCSSSYRSQTLIALYSSHPTFSCLLNKVQMNILCELVANYLCFLNSYQPSREIIFLHKISSKFRVSCLLTLVHLTQSFFPMDLSHLCPSSLRLNATSSKDPSFRPHFCSSFPPSFCIPQCHYSLQFSPELGGYAIDSLPRVIKQSLVLTKNIFL